jgi:SAM-dependent methyltransferase
MQRKHELELLDNTTLDAAELHRNLQDIARLNRWTGTTEAVVRAIEAMAAQNHTPIVVIDIGTGAGDLPTALVSWAERKRLPLRVFGGDIHNGVLDYARLHGKATDWLRLEATHLPLATRSIDVAVCTVMAHHLEPERLVSFIAEMQRVSRIGFVLMDLERSRLAWIALWLLTRLTSRNLLTRHDGPLSIERAYKRTEILDLAASAGVSLRVLPLFPFRWIASWRAEPHQTRWL